MTANSIHNSHKGIILKQAREAQGVSLESIHETTKIPMDVLRAIEEGYTVRTLNPFYYRGFVKMYAHHLGIDASNIIEEHKPEEQKIKATINISRPTAIIRPAPVIKPAPPAAKPIYPEYDFRQALGKLMTRERRQQGAAVLVGIVAFFILIKVITGVRSFFVSHRNQPKVEKVATPKEVKKEIVHDRKKSPPVKSLASKGEERTPVPVAVTPSATSVAPAATAAASSTSSENSRQVSLTVRAKRNSWLQVKADGNVVFQSTLNKGDVETWMADDRIELSGKNINELEFELNGKMIGALGGADRLARRLIVTKDGLTVKK